MIIQRLRLNTNSNRYFQIFMPTNPLASITREIFYL